VSKIVSVSFILEIRFGILLKSKFLKHVGVNIGFAIAMKVSIAPEFCIMPLVSYKFTPQLA